MLYILWKKFLNFSFSQDIIDRHVTRGVHGVQLIAPELDRILHFWYQFSMYLATGLDGYHWMNQLQLLLRTVTLLNVLLQTIQFCLCLFDDLIRISLIFNYLKVHMKRNFGYCFYGRFSDFWCFWIDLWHSEAIIFTLRPIFCCLKLGTTCELFIAYDYIRDVICSTRMFWMWNVYVLFS